MMTVRDLVLTLNSMLSNGASPDMPIWIRVQIDDWFASAPVHLIQHNDVAMVLDGFEDDDPDDPERADDPKRVVDVPYQSAA